jgi:uncharacterized protein YicC (UPF0701 family)
MYAISPPGRYHCRAGEVIAQRAPGVVADYGISSPPASVRSRRSAADEGRPLTELPCLPTEFAIDEELVRLKPTSTQLGGMLRQEEPVGGS